MSIDHPMKSVGKYTYDVCNITMHFSESGAGLFLGSFCSISSGCVVYLGGNHRSEWATTYPFGHMNPEVFDKFDGAGHPKTNGNVVIGNDVWTGSDTTIMSGVTVGDGAVIAANSHVVKNVEPYSIVGGNPARLIRYRFEEDIRKKLVLLKWWDLPDDKINQITPLLCSTRYCELIRALEDLRQ